MIVDRDRAAIGQLEQVFHELEKWLAALPPAAFELPVFTGEGDGWRVRDVLPHWASWQRLAARVAERIASGVEPPPEPELRLRTFLGLGQSVDELNAETFERWRRRPVAELFTELKAAHVALMEALRTLPHERLVKANGELYRYFWQPGLNHLQQHRAHIEQALKEKSTP